MDLDESDFALAAGEVVGDYRVVAPLGKGGMGIVYVAEHKRLGRRVALKVLRPEAARDPRLVKRFFAEARAANAVGHPNIVEIIDFYEAGAQRCYVMELLEGKSLADVVRAKEDLPLGRVLSIARQIAAGLAAVHEAHIVHRDLKPDNVFLVGEGRSEIVKLLDFGIAKLVDESGDLAHRTQTGIVLGTPAYMAPEQMKGGAVDERTDVYALGVILFEMLMGHRPFTATSVPELMMLTVYQPAPDVPDDAAPASIRALVARCLAKAPKDRPADMHEVQRELTLLDDETALPVSLSSEAPLVSITEEVAPVHISSDPTETVIAEAPSEATAIAHVGTTTQETGSARPVLVFAQPRTRIALAAAAVVVLGVVIAAIVFVSWSSSSPVATTPPVAHDAHAAAREAEVHEAPSASVTTAKLHVTSTPAGARVVMRGRDEPLGTTPLDVTLPHGPVHIDVALAGHEPASRDLDLDDDTNVDVTLAKKPRAHVEPRVEGRNEGRCKSSGDCKANAPCCMAGKCATPTAKQLSDAILDMYGCPR